MMLQKQEKRLLCIFTIWRGYEKSKRNLLEIVLDRHTKSINNFLFEHENL